MVKGGKFDKYGRPNSVCDGSGRFDIGREKSGEEAESEKGKGLAVGVFGRAHVRVRVRLTQSPTPLCP